MPLQTSAESKRKIAQVQMNFHWNNLQTKAHSWSAIFLFPALIHGDLQETCVFRLRFRMRVAILDGLDFIASIKEDNI